MDLPLNKDLRRVGVVQGPYILAKALAKMGNIEMHIISCNESISKDFVIEASKIQLHFLRLSHPALLPKAISYRLKAKKYLQKINPDIVHIHSPNYTFVKHNEGRRVITFHGLGLLNEYNDENMEILSFMKYLRMFVRFLANDTIFANSMKGRISQVYVVCLKLLSLRREENIIAVSNYVKEKLNHFTDSKIWEFPNPVNERYFEIENNKDRDKRLLLIASNDPEVKGIKMAFQVIEEIKKYFPNIKLRIAGALEKSPGFPLLIEYLKSKSIEDNVMFLGCLNEKDLFKEYRDCSVVIVTSKFETFFLPGAEGLAAGKPVVGTKVGFLPEVISDSENGFLVDYGDYKKFAQRLITLLKDPSMRREMGKRGRKEALRRFLPKVVAQQMKEFYEYVLKAEKRNKRLHA